MTTAYWSVGTKPCLRLARCDGTVQHVLRTVLLENFKLWLLAEAAWWHCLFMYWLQSSSSAIEGTDYNAAVHILCSTGPWQTTTFQNQRVQQVTIQDDCIQFGGVSLHVCTNCVIHVIDSYRANVQVAK